MQAHEGSIQSAPKRTSWNKGKIIGAKPPLWPKHVWSIRTKLHIEGADPRIGTVQSCYR